MRWIVKEISLLMWYSCSFLCIHTSYLFSQQILLRSLDQEHTALRKSTSTNQAHLNSHLEFATVNLLHLSSLMSRTINKNSSTSAFHFYFFYFTFLVFVFHFFVFKRTKSRIPYMKWVLIFFWEFFCILKILFIVVTIFSVKNDTVRIIASYISAAKD